MNCKKGRSGSDIGIFDTPEGVDLGLADPGRLKLLNNLCELDPDAVLRTL